MKDYSTFIFDSYNFDERTGRIELVYSLDDEVKFVETIELPDDGMYPKGVDPEILDRALFMLHLIGGISYYKTCIPKNIELRSGKLNKKQAIFWNTVYEKGLGEFFYQNKIDFEGLIDFPVESDTPTIAIKAEHKHNRVLVPIGGGKDSIVTAEILKSAKIPCVFFRMGAHPLIEEMAKQSRLPLMNIKRSIAPNLLELNAQGALNGHIPITAYLHCLSFLTALLYGYDFVVFSNERSASEGNMEYKGKEINHQWSKSIEFERLFQQYVMWNITPSLPVFSLLRGMSELLITSSLAQLPQYFDCVTSCNKNWKITGEKPGKRWCNECPKCAFAFCQFAAFLDTKTLLQIFGKNLFEEKELIPLYRKLLGLEGFKPFECVGTPDETTAAFLLALKEEHLEETPVMQMFIKEKAPKIKDVTPLIEQMLEVTEDHAIPITFSAKLHADT